MIEYFILAFFSGILVKIVDHIEDESGRRKKSPIRWPLSIIYGLLIGYLISQAPFAMIFLGAAIAQILMRKVDTWTHKLGYLSMLISILYFGLPEFLFLPLGVFIAFSAIDELDKFLLWKKPVWVQEFRPFLELVAVPFIMFGQWHYLAGILAFDVGYLSIRVMASKKLKRKKL